MRKFKALEIGAVMAVLLLCGSTLSSQEKRWSNDNSTKEDAARSLRQFEEEFAATSDRNMRFYALSKMAPTAFAADDKGKAERYSKDLLSMALDLPRDWNFGNAVHVGNLVLGRLALASGNVAEAKRYLLESGNTPGSPQLDSFGPNMILAKELLQKGERETVLQYFDLCRRFWEKHEAKLDSWAATVKAGEVPDFGANLLYGIEFRARRQ